LGTAVCLGKNPTSNSKTTKNNQKKKTRSQ